MGKAVLSREVCWVKINLHDLVSVKAWQKSQLFMKLPKLPLGVFTMLQTIDRGSYSLTYCKYKLGC